MTQSAMHFDFALNEARTTNPRMEADPEILAPNTALKATLTDPLAVSQDDLCLLYAAKVRKKVSLIKINRTLPEGRKIQLSCRVRFIIC